MLAFIWLTDESERFYSLLVLVTNLTAEWLPTRNLSERSPFLDHLSQSCSACFQLPPAMASCMGRILRSLTLGSDMFRVHQVYLLEKVREDKNMVRGKNYESAVREGFKEQLFSNNYFTTRLGHGSSSSLLLVFLIE